MVQGTKSCSVVRTGGRGGGEHNERLGGALLRSFPNRIIVAGNLRKFLNVNVFLSHLFIKHFSCKEKFHFISNGNLFSVMI